MFEDTQILTQPRRPQFSLRTLFVCTTAVSLLLGLGYWIGWLKVSVAILAGTTFCQLAVTFWPVSIGVLWWFGADAKLYGKCVLVLGMFFLVHLPVSILCFEMPYRGPSVLDLSGSVRTTLNWTVPSVLAGLLVGMYFGLTARSTLSYLVGCFLAAVALVGFVCLATRLDTCLVPSSSAWWM